jgi:hypothetical protein
MAYKYVGYAVFPMLVCYAIYSLIYNEHKSVYSYIVNMLAGAVYTFGAYTGVLLLCIPQLLRKFSRSHDGCVYES